MEILKGERVSLSTLRSLGFYWVYETHNEQVWRCGDNTICVTKATQQRPLVVWIDGMAGYMGNKGLRALQVDNSNPNLIRMRPSDVRQRLRFFADGKMYAKAIFGY
jgi:hypothetical protein